MWSCVFITLILGLSATFAEPIDCSKNPKGGFKGCCDKPNVMAKIDKAEKCMELIPEMNGVEKRGGLYRAACFMECLINDTGIFENDDVNVEEATNYLTTLLEDDPEFLQITLDSLESCIEFAKIKIKEHLPVAAGQCSPLPISVAACLGSAMFVNCPEDKWHESDECNQNREFIKACRI